MNLLKNSKIRTPAIFTLDHAGPLALDDVEVESGEVVGGRQKPCVVRLAQNGGVWSSSVGAGHDTGVPAGRLGTLAGGEVGRACSHQGSRACSGVSCGGDFGEDEDLACTGIWLFYWQVDGMKPVHSKALV